MAALKFPPTKYVLLSIPAPRILLVTMNLARQMNSLPVAASWEMDQVWDWFDEEPELYVVFHVLERLSCFVSLVFKMLIVFYIMSGISVF
jgi:hypothetical protein